MTSKNHEILSNLFSCLCPAQWSMQPSLFFVAVAADAPWPRFAGFKADMPWPHFVVVGADIPFAPTVDAAVPLPRPAARVIVAAPLPRPAAGVATAPPLPPNGGPPLPLPCKASRMTDGFTSLSESKRYEMFIDCRMLGTSVGGIQTAGPSPWARMVALPIRSWRWSGPLGLAREPAGCSSGQPNLSAPDNWYASYVLFTRIDL